ncbi:hypothetical protein MESS4_50041 [Mesorhizobium sp. STM 4661]|nr:hypothetical protein MESS4_50041 [Mesorhizobium sp. STM 4661]
MRFLGDFLYLNPFDRETLGKVAQVRLGNCRTQLKLSDFLRHLIQV